MDIRILEAPKVVGIVIRKSGFYTAVYSDSTIVNWTLDRKFKLINSNAVALDISGVNGILALPENYEIIFVYSANKIIRINTANNFVVEASLLKDNNEEKFDIVFLATISPFSIFTCDNLSR